MTFVIGLTGSIGMGKSTTAQMFVDAGIPVWDADGVVHQMYEKDGLASKAIAKAYPSVIVGGAVDRSKLRALISKTPTVLDHVQSMVHPLVAQHRADFLRNVSAAIVVLDIPLLFEIGADKDCDDVAVVYVPEDVQQSRVLGRGEMTKADFEMILSRQIPDANKRKKARWVIETLTLDGARQSVTNILAEIEKELPDA